jgi:signal peptidase II
LSTKLKIVLGLSLALLAIDQATKIWVVRTLELGRDEVRVIPGFLSFVHAQNPGAAMGLFTTFTYRLPLFLLFTAVAVWVLVGMYRQIPSNDRLQAAMIGCVLGGAVGNLIDRVHKQTVTDFIRVYTESPALVAWLQGKGLPTEWPTFNVADSAIVVGVGLYLVHYVFVERRQAASAARERNA